jgi:hypothetical protein
MTEQVPAPTKVDRFISATYCDDIRQETHNKFSLMGIYQSFLYVPEFPARLLRLCVILTMHSPKTQPFESVRIVAYRDGVPLADTTIAPPKENWLVEPVEGYVGAVVPLVFENMEIMDRAQIRVRAFFDDGSVIPAPSLRIEMLPGTRETARRF